MFGTRLAPGSLPRGYPSPESEPFCPWRLSGLLSGCPPTGTRPQARAKLGRDHIGIIAPRLKGLFRFIQRIDSRGAENSARVRKSDTLQAEPWTRVTASLNCRQGSALSRRVGSWSDCLAAASYKVLPRDIRFPRANPLVPGGCPASCPDAHRPARGHRHVRNWAGVT